MEQTAPDKMKVAELRSALQVNPYFITPLNISLLKAVDLFYLVYFHAQLNRSVVWTRRAPSQCWWLVYKRLTRSRFLR